MKKLHYGLSGNPIGNHHLMMAQIACEQGGYDKVVFIPCFDAPHKTDLLSFEHRYEMCRLATSYYGSPFEVSDIERDLFLKNNRPSYTVETVRELKARGEKEVHLLLGTDSMRDLPKWKEPEALIEEVYFVLAPRLRPFKEYGPLEPHHHQPILLHDPLLKRAKIVMRVTLPVIDVSSTLIRERRQQGLSIRHFVPRGVDEYISQNKLYQKAVNDIGTCSG